MSARITSVTVTPDRFARRRPALFVGAAFVAGLGVSQLLKSAALAEASAPRDRADGSMSDMASGVGA